MSRARRPDAVHGYSASGISEFSLHVSQPAGRVRHRSRRRRGGRKSDGLKTTDELIASTLSRIDTLKRDRIPHANSDEHRAYLTRQLQAQTEMLEQLREEKKFADKPTPSVLTLPGEDEADWS